LTISGNALCKNWNRISSSAHPLVGCNPGHLADNAQNLCPLA
jgi:hypothetical protein